MAVDPIPLARAVALVADRILLVRVAVSAVAPIHPVRAAVSAAVAEMVLDCCDKFVVELKTV